MSNGGCTPFPLRSLDWRNTTHLQRKRCRLWFGCAFQGEWKHIGPPSNKNCCQRSERRNNKQKNSLSSGRFLVFPVTTAEATTEFTGMRLVASQETTTEHTDMATTQTHSLIFSFIIVSSTLAWGLFFLPGVPWVMLGHLCLKHFSPERSSLYDDGFDYIHVQPIANWLVFLVFLFK